METVHFSYDANGLADLLNTDWRWRFREEPQKTYRAIQDAFPEMKFVQLDAFLRGKFDFAATEDNELTFIETGKDQTDEIFLWVEKQLVQTGEAAEIYKYALDDTDERICPSDYRNDDEYFEVRDEHIETYTIHLEREKKKLEKWITTWNWFHTNWDTKRQMPIIRAISQILYDEKVSELLVTDYSLVDFHGMVMTKDGRCWWLRGAEYYMWQHSHITRELNELNIDTQDVLNYNPHNGWLTWYPDLLTPEQRKTIVEFTLAHDQTIVLCDNREIPIENFLKEDEIS